jgi:hypothetical protein
MCLHLYEPGGHTSGEPPIQQIHHVCEQLTTCIAMKRELEVGSTQTEQHGHCHDRVRQNGASVSAASLTESICLIKLLAKHNDPADEHE